MSPNKEDYLKHIYQIGQLHTKVTNKDIASSMQVSPPAVTDMIKKLIQQDWIQKDKEKGYLILEKGLERIAQLYRKHRLIEVFLIEKLGYSIDQVHEEAEILEHSVSDYFIQRLDILLDRPEVCPHGGVIPQEGQVLTEIYQHRLSQVQEVGRYRLVRVEDQMDLLHFLERHRVQVGQSLDLETIDPYSRDFAIQTDQTSFSIPQHIAQQLYVESI